MIQKQIPNLIEELTKKLTQHHCNICGTNWLSRLTYPPVVCIRCKRRDWREPRKEKEVSS